MSRKRVHGQSLAEFALILLVLLLLVFIIIDASRILWGWVTVQNATREGARYAITGRDDCGSDVDRLTCVISTTHAALDALPLNEDPNALFEDDNYYQIEVWGVNADNELINNFPGAAGKPVIVRAYYRVRVITPLLRPIRESLMVFGQVTLTNELFNSLGGDNAGIGIPPPIPPLPTPGVTPSATNTPTPGATATETAIPTATLTPSPTRCDTHFEGNLVHDDTFANVTGDIGGNVIVYDLSIPGTPPVLGTAILGEFDGHDCEGYALVNPLTPPLSGGHVILVSNNTDGSSDTQIVLNAPPTDTPSPTFTPLPTLPPTETSTPTSSPTPADPYVVVFPSCTNNSTINITIQGFNWTNASSTITLFWVPDGQSPEVITILPVGHPASFTFPWSRPNVPDGNHMVHAVSGADSDDAPFTVPCPAPSPTPGPSPTNTPAPADLTIMNVPVLISTRPIVEYQPVQFQVEIENQGGVEINDQFFTDIFLDPDPTNVYSNTIAIIESDGYLAVSSIVDGQTKVLTITAPLGFTGGMTSTRVVYGVVDSILQIDESDEFNNISPPLYVSNVTPAPSPTPSPIPSGTDKISGVVRAFLSSSWVPVFRAQVYLVAGPQIINVAYTDANGIYEFSGVDPGTYDVYACYQIEDVVHTGVRTGISPPNPFADIFMLPDPGGCPVGP